MDVTTIIVAVLGSNLLVEIFKALKDALSKKPDPIKSAICALLRDRILHLCVKYIDIGEVEHRQWASLYSLYENYKALGGNGFIDDEVDNVSKLPRI